MATIEQARNVKQQLSVALEQHPGFVGVGITRVERGFGVKVNVRRPSDDPDLPPVIDDVPVEVAVVGHITAR